METAKLLYEENFEIDGDKLYKVSSLYDKYHDMTKKELIIDKETFVKCHEICYNEWIAKDKNISD